LGQHRHRDRTRTFVSYPECAVCRELVDMEANGRAGQRHPARSATRCRAARRQLLTDAQLRVGLNPPMGVREGHLDDPGAGVRWL